MTLEDLGQAKKVTIDKDNTTIIEGAGSPRRSRVVSSNSARRSRTRRPTTTGEAAGAPRQAGRRRGHHQSRGGDQTEMKEKKARVEDAMHATKAAVEEGIVAGGGVALLRASRCSRSSVTGEEQVGVNIIRRAIEEPMRWIATNAGHEGAIVVQRVKEMTGDEGFNAQSEGPRIW